ncbi:hypothetical protein ACFPRL_21155 [Pseudoclavibacter helvolus]
MPHGAFDGRQLLLAREEANEPGVGVPRVLHDPLHEVPVLGHSGEAQERVARGEVREGAEGPRRLPVDAVPAVVGHPPHLAGHLPPDAARHGPGERGRVPGCTDEHRCSVEDGVGRRRDRGSELSRLARRLVDARWHAPFRAFLGDGREVRVMRHLAWWRLGVGSPDAVRVAAGLGEQ